MQDAACLERARLKNGKIFLYTKKTGTPVYCPLPPTVVIALEGVSNTHPDYFFWDGRSERETTVKSWNRVFRKLFAMTDPPIEGGHPHRFRDTFAVSLLLNGVEGLRCLTRISLPVHREPTQREARRGHRRFTAGSSSGNRGCGGPAGRRSRIVSLGVNSHSLALDLI